MGEGECIGVVVLCLRQGCLVVGVGQVTKGVLLSADV